LKRNVLLALLSALILWLAWPPIPYTGPLLLLGFFPLLLAVDTIMESGVRKKGRKIFWISFLTFFVWNTACIYWVFNSLNAVLGVSTALLVSLIPYSLAAFLMSFAFWLYYRIRRITNSLVSYTALICFWIGYEYLHQSWDLSFPWMTLGNGFASTHQVIQWYEFTGVYGGTLWIWICNILFFELYKSFRYNTANKTRLGLSSVFAVAIPVGLSLAMYFRYQEKSNPANVVVVQPNIDPYARWRTIPSFLQVQEMIQLSEAIGQPNTEYFYLA
jgi:apolipoprotein N-acyltransferase